MSKEVTHGLGDLEHVVGARLVVPQSGSIQFGEVIVDKFVGLSRSASCGKQLGELLPQGLDDLVLDIGSVGKIGVRSQLPLQAFPILEVAPISSRSSFFW